MDLLAPLLLRTDKCAFVCASVLRVCSHFRGFVRVNFILMVQTKRGRLRAKEKERDIKLINFSIPAALSALCPITHTYKWYRFRCDNEISLVAATHVYAICLARRQNTTIYQIKCVCAVRTFHTLCTEISQQHSTAHITYHIQLIVFRGVYIIR